jgi:hypothetical protein
LKVADALWAEPAIPLPRKQSKIEVPQSWLVSQIPSSMNQLAWSQNPEIKAWIALCRLDGFGRAGREVDRTDPEVKAIYNRIREVSMPAFANMQKLATT